MSKMGKIWTIVGSVLAVVVIGAFGFCTVWTVRNWDTVYKSLDGSSVYTNEDIKRTEQETWEKAAKNEAEYQNTIAELRDLVTGLQVDNAALSDEVAALNISISANESEIRQLSIRKANLESQVASLQENKTANENTINALNSQIATLRTQADQVTTLNSQITTLQATVNQLQSINDSNVQTISNLNTQIVSLNNQIRDLSATSQNASAQITALTNRCNELQASINYYESFISTQENSTQAVATYEVDGAVWKIEIVNKGEITLPQFTNTATLIFNGWTVNDTLLGSTYTISANTKFIASVVHKHAVQFMTDDVVYNSQYVIENEYATVPTAPTKAGYDFLGWSLNSVDIVNGINATAVTENVTYHAVFVKVHTVTFMNGDQVVATQNVRNGEYANANNVTVETDGTFMGWQINDSTVVVNNYQILADTVFVAQISFDDWIVVSLCNNNDFKYGLSGLFELNGHCYCVQGGHLYEFDLSTNTLTLITWNGLPSSATSNFFIYDNHLYWLGGDSSMSYELDLTTWTWVKLSDGPFYRKIGSFLRVINGHVYETNSYGYLVRELDLTTNSWNQITWTGLTGVSDVKAMFVWTVGNHVYYSSDNNQYELDLSTNTWNRITWTGLTNLNGFYVWTVGNHVYYSSGNDHYELDLSTNTWNRITWTGLTNFYGSNVRTFGNHAYYYVNNSSTPYMLNNKAA